MVIPPEKQPQSNVIISRNLYAGDLYEEITLFIQLMMTILKQAEAVSAQRDGSTCCCRKKYQYPRACNTFGISETCYPYQAHVHRRMRSLAIGLSSLQSRRQIGGLVCALTIVVMLRS